MRIRIAARRAAVALCLMIVVGSAIAREDFEAVDTAARDAVAHGEIPSVAYAVSRNGHVIHASAVGFADRERHVPATLHTPYRLASLTKPITATALLVLHERSGVSLDAPISNLLSFLSAKSSATNDPWREVTLARLLHHTAGLGTYARIYFGDEIAAAAASFPASLQDYSAPVQTPGSVAEYSNLGYGLLGEVIAQRSHMSFAEYVRRNVFSPLQMRDSFIADIREKRGAVAYDTALAPLPAFWNDTPGAGNAYASVDDMLRFGWFHLAPRSAPAMRLSQQTIAGMQQRDADRARHPMYGDAWYGQGWYVRGEPATLIWHEGGMPGASTLLALYPACRAVVTVLVNRSDAQAFVQALAGKLVDPVCEHAPPLALDPVSGFSPLTRPSSFTGEWHGSVRVDAEMRPVKLKIDASGNGLLSYVSTPGGTAIDREFHAITSGASLISAVQGPWQSRGAPDGASALLIKLVRTDADTLEGALVAYDGPQRLRFLLPYAVAMQRNGAP
jgi:CubicO group peptidase (beta-lactamase class C family)